MSVLLTQKACAFCNLIYFWHSICKSFTGFWKITASESLFYFVLSLSNPWMYVLAGKSFSDLSLELMRSVPVCIKAAPKKLLLFAAKGHLLLSWFSFLSQDVSKQISLPFSHLGWWETGESRILIESAQCCLLTPYVIRFNSVLVISTEKTE